MSTVGLLCADLLKVGRYPLLRWLGIALLVLVLLRGVAWPPDPAIPWTGLWSSRLVAVALIMLTAVTVGQEFSEDTFRSLVSRGVPRWWMLVSKFVLLILVGGVLLAATEGLATFLGIRQQLHWGDVLRAWLSLWPYVGLIMLLTVLARNGGLALVVGVIWLFLELTLGALLSPFAMLPDTPEFRFLSPHGVLGTLYQWTLDYNGVNWTYVGEFQRAPMPTNTMLWARPHSALCSVLMLAAFTMLGVGLSILVVSHRDVTEVVQGKKGLPGLIRRHSGREKHGPTRRRDALPTWTGRGPIVLRLLRANLFKMGRTSLIKIGAVVSLLFPLALWGAAKALKATGYQDLLFSPGPQGSPPMAITASLLAVGPLATVLGILAVSNDLSLGTRRAELTRGVTRLQSIVAQSLTLIAIIGVMYAFLMFFTLLLGMEVVGTLRLGNAALAVLVAMLAAGAYIGAAQLGGALSQSPLGAMFFGLGFLVADWAAILTPTLMIENLGPLLDLGRYAVFANTFALANRGQITGIDIEWQHLGMVEAALLLLGYTAALQGLAVLIACWRDA